MKNLTLNDPTQKILLGHLKNTENLLARVATKLSGKQKSAEIIAMPDLGIAHNCTRMNGGFFTGAIYSWDSDVPFISVDATVNVCGTGLFKINGDISIEAFCSKVESVLADKSKYTWNYTAGNHFASLVKSNGEYGLPAGYYMLVHASANEFKYNDEQGLYPTPTVWFNSDIQIETDGLRYLRYISGDSASRFYEIAKNLIEFNTERNRYFVHSVLGNMFEKEILSIHHYGMPNDHTVCIGAHWEEKTYTLLTAPGRPVYLVKPTNDFYGSPHGFGLELTNPTVTYTPEGISFSGKTFGMGESITIGKDALNRCTSDGVNLDDYISKILAVCPGEIVGKLSQIVSFSKDGLKIWENT